MLFRTGLFLLLCVHLTVNRFWNHSDVEMFGLNSSDHSPLCLSHILSLPLSNPLPRSSLSPSDLSVWQHDKSSKQTRPTILKYALGLFCLLSPCSFVVGAAPAPPASFYFNCRKDRPHLVFGFKGDLPNPPLPLHY